VSQQTQSPERARPVGIRAAFFEAPTPVKTVLVGVFINRLGQFLTLFLVLYLSSKGYSAERASFALGAYGAGAVVGVLIGGTLAYRLGPRNATALSMVGSCAIMTVWIFLPTYSLLVLAAVLYAILTQVYRPASSTLLSELTPDDRQVMIFGLYRFGLNLGATAAPMLGLGLYYLDGRHYQLVFWGQALVALCYAVFAWVALPSKQALAEGAYAVPGTQAAAPEAGEAAPEPVVEPVEDLVADLSAEPVADPGSAPGPGPAGTGKRRGWRSSGYLAVLRDRWYVVYLFALLIHSAVYVQYQSTLPLNVKAAHVAIVWYTLAVSLNGFIVICFELLLTKVTQTWPMRLSIGLTVALLGVGVALYGLPFGPAVILCGTLVWSLGEIIGGPATFAYPGLTAPPNLKSYYIGSFQFMFGLGSALGPAIGGWLFVSLGHGAWPVIALGSVVATVLVLVSVRQPPGARQPSR
jgi:predicted MFS family arabinose efflux permease